MEEVILACECQLPVFVHLCSHAGIRFQDPVFDARKYHLDVTSSRGFHSLGSRSVEYRRLTRIDSCSVLRMSYSTTIPPLLPLACSDWLHPAVSIVQH
jgi:hypothetical protein